MARLFLIFLLLLPIAVSAELYVTIIQGLDGSENYGLQFTEQSTRLNIAAESITENSLIEFISGAQATRENILAHFNELNKGMQEDDRIAVFLIGHGSYDGYEYKFNIPGPDITGEDIESFMNALPARIQLLVNTSSASGAISEQLRSENRVLITATRNGNERLATRFGEYFFEAIEDTSADLNKNNAVTAQEAFDFAERMVKDYFENQGQLATEHPQISGDYAGQFVVARLDQQRPKTENPELTRLFSERGAIDLKIEELQLKKGELQLDDFLSQLQMLMIELSTVQEKIDQLDGDSGE
jgi:hypothetical protein